jgi:eIF3 subunit M, C-terminal helix
VQKFANVFLQGEGVVYVSSTMHRTFGLGDWQQLHTLLTSWKENLNTVKEQLANVASTQVWILVLLVRFVPVLRIRSDPHHLVGTGSGFL